MTALPARSRPAFWLILPGLLLVWLYTGMYISNSYVKGYWASAMSNAALFLLFSCGLAAVSSAVEGSRDRSGKLGDHAVVRSPARIMAERLWPSLGCGFFVQAVGTLHLTTGAWGAPGRAPWELMLTYLAIVFFHTSLGYVLGRALPPIASVPLSLLLSYGWLGFTWSVPYFPLRYLAGPALASCCGPASEPNPVAVWAPVMFSVPAGILLLALGAINPPLVRAAAVRAGRARTRKLLAASAVVVLGIAGVTTASLFLARDVGAFAFQDRAEADLQCTGANPTVCLFPEQFARTDPRPTIRDIVNRLHTVGMPEMTQVKAGMGGRETTDGTAIVVVGIGASSLQLAHSVASSYTSPLTEMDCGPIDPRPRLRAYELLSAWLDLQAARGLVDPAQVRNQLHPEVLADLDQLMARPFKDQGVWARNALASLKQCEVPDLEPRA